MSEKELESMVRRIVREEMGTGSELVTIAQGAALVSVGVSTIRSWIKEGTIRRYGEGRVVRVSKREVLAAMEKRSGATTQVDAEKAIEKILGGK